MKVTLEHLWQLQELDRRVLTLRQETQFLPDVKGNEAELKRVQLQEQELKLGLDGSRLNRNQVKAALDSCRQRLLKAEAAVKEIKSAEVFQATTKEIEQLKKLEQSLEMKERSIQKDADSLNVKIEEIQRRRVDLEEKIQASSGLKKSSEHEVDAVIQEVNRLKAPIQAQIQLKYLSLYRRITEARGGIGMAKVRGNSCDACHMVLPAQFVNDLTRSGTLETCPSCKRILMPVFDDSGRAVPAL